MRAAQGVTLHRPEAAALRTGILSGDWQLADDALDALSPRDGDADALLAARWLVRRHKLVECLLAPVPDLPAAVAVLRFELAPLPVPAAVLHATAQLLLCTTRTSMAAALAAADSTWEVTASLSPPIVPPWAASGTATPAHASALEAGRAQLLERVAGVLSPVDVVPQRRLEALVEQALRAQVAACVFHNADVHAVVPSLLRDYACGREHLPSVCCAVLREHNDEIWHLAFSPLTGSRLATACKDGVACVWRLHGSAQGVSAVCELQLRGHTGSVTHVSWSPDETHLLTCSADRTARIWDTRDGTCVRVLARHTDVVSAGVWEPCGSVVYTAGNDKKIVAWDVHAPAAGDAPASASAERACWRVPRVNDLGASKDGSLLAAVCAEKRVRLWWPATGREHWLTESDAVTSLCVSRDGRFLLVSLQNQELHLWDLSSAGCSGSSAAAGGDDMPASRPAGSSGAPAGPPFPTAPAFKFRGQAQCAGRYIVRATLGGGDEQFVASGSEDSQLYIWHRAKGDLLAVLPGHTSVINAVHWNAVQPGLLASASDDRTVRLWASEALLARIRLGESLIP